MAFGGLGGEIQCGTVTLLPRGLALFSLCLLLPDLINAPMALAKLLFHSPLLGGISLIMVYMFMPQTNNFVNISPVIFIDYFGWRSGLVALRALLFLVRVARCNVPCTFCCDSTPTPL